MRITIALALFTAAAAVVPGHAAGPQVAPPSPVAATGDARAVLDKYCATCHSDRVKAGGLSIQSLDLNDIGGGSPKLEKIVRKMRAGLMPPKGNPRPDDATYNGLRGWMEAQLDQYAAAHLNPGRTEGLHRLNRVEYQNAVRDLLDLEGLDFATLLPKDDASYGFDNIAGVLGMSATHLDQFLAAARTISRYAVGDITLPPSGETHVIRPDLSQDGRLEELPLGTRGGIRLQRYFPVDATYTLRFQAHTGVGLSEEEPNFIEVSIDGRRVFYEKMKQRPIRHAMSGFDIQANTDWEIKIPIRAGLRDLMVTFAQTTSAELDDLLQPYLRPPGISAFRLTRMGGYSGPYVAQLTFLGPFEVTGPGDTPARRRIFSCRPANASAEPACARQILSTLGRRAYRRPVNDADVSGLYTFYEKGRKSGTFDTGIQVALERLLTSPDFLFRVEDDHGAAGAQPYRISDLELASRLSFFLWSSIPDDQLLDTAIRGQLHDPKVLDQEVRRMLKDSKSEALTANFAGQWLRLRAIPGVERNPQMFPDFDDNMRLSMRRETELFFDSVVREDRSALDLLRANYTYVNERLARHYGLPNIYGSHFRRVTIADPNRYGLLGQASVLSVTSQANRTSPVTRGKWVLENLLGAPPPAPPANVPPLEQTEAKGTLRQRMEQHRKNPVCASCHNMMDPLGFALENFDPLGQWRVKDEGNPVDASGAMPDGSKFEGVTGLRAAILARPEVFIETLTEKMMVYALGRGIEYYDAPSIRRIARVAAKDDYKITRIISGIVNSAPFQMRAPASPAGPATSTAN